MRRGLIGGGSTVSNLVVNGSGTNQASWTVNNDATAPVNEDPFIILQGGDGTNLVDYRILLETSSEAVEYRTRRDGTEIKTALHLGTPAQIAAINQEIYLNSGSGAVAKQYTIKALSAGALEFNLPSSTEFYTFKFGGAQRLTLSNTSAGLQLEGAPFTVTSDGTAASPIVKRSATNDGLYFPSGQVGLSSNAIGQEYQNGTVQTTDATVTTIATVALSDETVYNIEAVVTARDQAGTSAQRGTWRRYGCFYREGAGSATQQGSTVVVGTDIETTAGMDVTMTVSGDNVLVRATGIAATTIRWHVHCTIYPVSTT